jgi:hypothetical protein
VEGSCEHDNESSGPMKRAKFFYLLSNYQLLADSAPWNLLLRYLSVNEMQCYVEIIRAKLECNITDELLLRMLIIYGIFVHQIIG